MDIRQIRYFLAVAEEKSISRAAQRLLISQPPLSRQIKELEESIGTPLFYRTNSGLVLTKAGHLLQERGEALLSFYEETVNQLQALAKQEQNHIVFGSIDGSSTLIAPVYTKLYRKKFSNAQVVSQVGTAEEITDLLLKGEVDIGFVRYPFRHMDQFRQYKLIKEKWQALMPPEHPLANEDMVSLVQLAQEKLIMPTRETLYLPLTQAFKAVGQDPYILSYYFELAKAAMLAKHTGAVAIVPESIKNIIKEESFLCKPIMDLELETGYMAICKKGDFRSENVEEFWGIILNHKFSL